MADVFFSSSWRILEPHGCAGSRTLFRHPQSTQSFEALTVLGLRGWLEVELDEDAEQLIDELASV
jgi:hypothetical protein